MNTFSVAKMKGFSFGRCLSKWPRNFVYYIASTDVFHGILVKDVWTESTALSTYITQVGC